VDAPILELERLGKRYRDKTAVRDLSFAVPRGSVYGFLGRNGAGKSTTIRMMLRLVRPTSGVVRVDGLDVRSRWLDVAPRVGALLEQPAFTPQRSGRANLEMLARAFRIPDRRRAVDEALGRARLGDAARRRFGTYSQGMRQSLGLAAALLREPDLLVLDEPTNGLDPEAIGAFRDLVRELRDRGATIFLSSHVLAEVETLCDRVAILHEGRLVAEGRLDELIDPDTATFEASVDDPSMALAVLGRHEACRDARASESDASTIRVEAPAGAAADLNAALVAAGVRVSRFAPVRRTLEHTFLEHTADRESDRRPRPEPSRDS